MEKQSIAEGENNLSRRRQRKESYFFVRFIYFDKQKCKYFCLSKDCCTLRRGLKVSVSKRTKRAE
ncbi:MAG: hypothetical protein D3904_16100 [Candidatus Electrothrix sp. EH2]|nr:hypothetical protein [Candidatus Electrothrix sp. EH2]